MKQPHSYVKQLLIDLGYDFQGFGLMLLDEDDGTNKFTKEDIEKMIEFLKWYNTTYNK